MQANYLNTTIQCRPRFFLSCFQFHSDVWLAIFGDLNTVSAIELENVALHKRVFSHGFSTTQPVKITPDGLTHLQITLETKSSASAQNSQNASVTGSLQLFESQFDSQYISRPPESMISPRIPHDLALCTLFALHHPPITGFNRITGAIFSCSRQPDRLSHCHTN